MKLVSSRLFSNIGWCSTCIQTAFRAALSAGSAFVLLAVLQLANVVSTSPYLTYAALVLFLSLTLVWILHVVVFGLRVANFSIKKALDVNAQKDEGDTAVVSRRNYLRIATQSALGIAAFTVANSMFISSASAMIQCGNRGVTCASNSENCCIWGDGTARCCPPGMACSYVPNHCG